MSDNYNQQEEYDFESWEAGGSVSDYNVKKEYVLPPEDIYVWELYKIGKPEQMEGEKTKLRTRLHFRVVDDEDFEGMTVAPFFTVSLHEKAKLTPFVKALCGHDLLPTDKIAWTDGTWEDAETGEVYRRVGIGNKRIKAALEHVKKEDGRVFGELKGPVPFRKRGKTAVATAEMDESNPPF